MRIAYVIDSIGEGGGAEQSLALLAQAMLARGVLVDVIVLRERPGHRQVLEGAGARVFSLDGTGGRAAWVLRSARLLRRIGPDLAHTSLFEADVTGRVGARLARVPVVSSLVSDSYSPAHLSEPALSRRKVRAVQSVDAATARLTRRLHAVSLHVAETMSRRLRYPRARIDVIPRGRDPKLLGEPSPTRRAAARSQLGISSDEKLVLTIGRQEHAKGLDVLLRATAVVRDEVPGVRVLVAGREGAATARLQVSRAELQLEPTVSFLGTRSDVPDLLCAADVLVLSSRREGFPGVLVEAMALGVPIVASDIPQVREVVGPDTALLSRPEDSRALARGIASALHDRDAALRRAVLARHRFEERFTIERMTDDMMAFYERSLSGASV